MSGLPVPEQLRRLRRLNIALTILGAVALAIAVTGNVRVAIAALAVQTIGQVVGAERIRNLLTKKGPYL